MEQKQVRSQFSHETMEELRKRVLDLEEQNRVLDAFIENSTDAIQISDRNLVTLRINRAYEVLTGIRREELVGVPVEQLVKNHLISESCGAIVAKTKKPHTIVQTFYRTGRSAHVSCTPVFDSCGEIEFNLTAAIKYRRAGHMCTAPCAIEGLHNGVWLFGLCYDSTAGFGNQMVFHQLLHRHPH